MVKPLQKIDEIVPAAGANQMEETGGAWADYKEGKAQLERGEVSMAAASLHNALVGFKETGDEKGIANASNQLGLVCMARKNYSEARNHFLGAEEVVRKLADPMSLLSLSKNIIEACTGMGEYQEALDRCMNNLDLYGANNDPRGSVNTIEKMAEIYVSAGRTDKAADAYRTVASIHKNFKHHSIAAEYLHKAEELDKK